MVGQGCGYLLAEGGGVSRQQSRLSKGRPGLQTTETLILLSGPRHQFPSQAMAMHSGGQFLLLDSKGPVQDGC